MTTATVDRMDVSIAAVYQTAAQLRVSAPRVPRWWPFLREHKLRKQIAEANDAIVQLRRVMTCELEAEDVRKFTTLFVLVVGNLNTGIERRLATTSPNDHVVRDMSALRDDVEDIAEALALASNVEFVTAMADEATGGAHADWRAILPQM